MRTKRLAVLDGKPVMDERELGDLPPRALRVEVFYSGVSQGTELRLIRASGVAQLGEVSPLGYQVLGKVREVGRDVVGIEPGQWVVCYGAPYVSHASVCDVPVFLAAPIAEQAAVPGAAFCGLATVALHAVRLSRLGLGEIAAVVGLGVVGNLVAQVASLAGARVVGVDTNAQRVARAEECGLEGVGTWETLETRTRERSEGQGADVVFLATNACGNDLLEQCARLVRLRGSLVIVGGVEAVLPRDVLFEKEAAVVVSRAGGPGRYDPRYEAESRDYPYGYVRWTEGRNLREVARLLSEGKLAVAPLVTTIARADAFESVYSELASDAGKHLGVVFDWKGLGA